MDTRIIRLGAEWADHYRNLRLESLKNHPDIYASSYEHEVTFTREQWLARLEEAWVAGLFHGKELAGIAALFAVPYARMCHKATIAAVYVRGAHQGKGWGRKLMEAALAEAATRFEQVNVSVVEHNISAIRLYESLGFERYGYEKRAAKWNGMYFNDILMVKFLTKSG